MPQTGWLKQQEFIFVIVLGGWKSRIKVVASMISGKGSSWLVEGCLLMSFHGLSSMFSYI